MKINTYDIDGVVFINKDLPGLTPQPGDMIITGRSFEERPETDFMLAKRGIAVQVHYNPLPFDRKSRVSSGEHKGHTLNYLKACGYEIGFHVEDDEVQIEQIKRIAPWVNVLHLVHNLTEKENVRHVF